MSLATECKKKKLFYFIFFSEINKHNRINFINFCYLAK